MRDPEAVAAAKKCVQAVLDYFYGDWRERLITMDGQKGETAWRKECLWLEEVQRSLPFASALSNWEAVKRIAAYPPEDMFPEAAKAKGEGAWGRAVLSYLRGEPRNKIEAFIAKAESKKTKRLILLGPVLRTLMDQHERKFADALLAYLAYYRKSEFKTELDKAIALDGTTLYHVGRKVGLTVQLPEGIAKHVVRFERV